MSPEYQEHEMSSLVWISGATQGIGEALAETVPFESARVVNLSRRQHPHLETVVFDLAEPSTWDRVVDHMASELRSSRYQRVIFIHSACLIEDHAFIGQADPAGYRRAVQANMAAPLVLGEAFIRNCPADVDAGLVFLTSGVAQNVAEGMAGYSAAKAAIEQWVRVAHRERATRGTGPWVAAVRPGLVDTPRTRHEARSDPRDLPNVMAYRAAFEGGEASEPLTVAREIWASLPPRGDDPILRVGRVPGGFATTAR
jgi:NAD(P)-dependent dehydrogenase (short-subunit alcohol dehydrogenase family)